MKEQPFHFAYEKQIKELRELNAELLTAMQDFISNVKRQKVAGYGDSEVQFDASFKEMERVSAKAEKLK